MNTSLNTPRRRAALLGLLSVVSLLATAKPTHAQALYSTGFEPEGFLAGETLVGQDGWFAPPPLSPQAAVVTADKPRQGRQTVRVLGSDLEPQGFIADATGGYYTAIGSYRRAVNHDTGNAQVVRISAHVRLDGPGTDAGDNFFSAAVSTRALTLEGTASVGEMALSSDGHVLVYSGNENVPTVLASVPAALGQWHSLAIAADFAAQVSAFYVDDILVATVPFEPTESFTGVLLRGTLLAYAGTEDEDHSRADYAAYYDRFTIQVTGK